MRLVRLHVKPALKRGQVAEVTELYLYITGLSIRQGLISRHLELIAWYHSKAWTQGIWTSNVNFITLYSLHGEDETGIICAAVDRDDQSL